MGNEAHIEDSQNPGNMIILSPKSDGGASIQKNFKSVVFDVWAVEVDDSNYTVKLECDKHPGKYVILKF